MLCTDKGSWFTVQFWMDWVMVWHACSIPLFWDDRTRIVQVYYPLQIFIIDWLLMFVNQTQLGADLTGGNWQKWKRVFLTCPCHEIYRDEAVGLKSCKNTWKITVFVKMWNLGQNRENLIFVNNCLIKAWILKILLHMCDTYNYDYLKYSTFRFNFVDFQLYIDFPFQFCVFYRKIT